MFSHVFSWQWIKKSVRFLMLLLIVGVMVITAVVVFIAIRHHQTLVLPAPTGSYAAGRIEYDWTDPSRIDPLAPHANTKRELVVWSWYPATRVSGASPAPYLPSKWGQLDSQLHGFLGSQLTQ